MRKTKRIAGIVSAVFVVTMSAATMTALAADSENAISVEENNYSYLAGQQRSSNRNELYAQAAAIEDEDERKAFLVENGIADTEYSAEAAAAYSYIGGRERGASYRSSDDTEQSEAQSGYSFVAGRQRGSSYRTDTVK